MFGTFLYVSNLERTLRSASVLAVVPLAACPPRRWAAQIKDVHIFMRSQGRRYDSARVVLS